MIVDILKRKIRKAVTGVYDPLTTIAIGNQTIKVNLSHQLREILRIFPDYNFNLARIVKYTNEAVGPIQIIDIGANVGDSVAFIKNYSDVPILCIDGDEKYFKLLEDNTSRYKNISICKSLVGFETKEENIRLKSEKGSAHMEKADKAVTVRSLEDILKEFPSFQNSKIIKTDTDGFDTLILRGCKAYLEKVKPVLFFEFDPHFIKMNNDDPLDFINYLKRTGYEHFMFYMNNGDYLLSCSGGEASIIEDVVHFLSGRNIEMYADVVAFVKEDEALFSNCRKQELAHFQQRRAY